MKTLSIIFMIMLTALTANTLLSGCSFGSGSDDQAKAYKEEKEALLRDFEDVLGTYQGSIQAYKASRDDSSIFATVEIPLQLGLYVEYVADGKDAAGKVMLRPVLKMRYRQMDTARDDVILDVRYLASSGELDAATAASNAMNTTVRANLSGRQLSGTITRLGGTLGRFSVNLKSREVYAPQSGDSTYDRMLTEYKRISGVYVGTVVSDTQATFPVELKLSSTPIVKEGVLSAELKASYRRLDSADSSMTERLLSVSYRLQANPAELVMSLDGGTAQIPNAFFMSLNGILQDGVYSADFYDRRGLVGVLTVKKK